MFWSFHRFVSQKKKIPKRIWSITVNKAETENYTEKPTKSTKQTFVYARKTIQSIMYRIHNPNNVEVISP